MTLDEARAIGRILRTADRGCPHCARALFSAIAGKFPAFTWTFQGEPVEPDEPPENETMDYDDWSVTEHSPE